MRLWGEDLLGGLGEHLREAREHMPGGLGERTLGAVKDGHGAAGDGGDGVPEWPGRVGGGRAPRLAGPAA